MEALSNVEDPAVHFSLTEVFDDQLNELKRDNAGKWRSELEIEWCNSKLYLYALTFLVPLTTHSSQHINRQQVLHRALEAASILIAEMTKLGSRNSSDLNPGGLLSFVPKPYFASLFNATTFIFRFMAVCISTNVQKSLALQLTVDAHKIFQSFPEQRELTRAAIHIEMFIDVLRHGASLKMDELVVTNKLGASVMFDAIFQACRQRNIDFRTGEALAVQDWKSVNEAYAQRLPEPPVKRAETDDGGSFGLAFQPNHQDEPFTSTWDVWETYMDAFQVGVEELGASGFAPVSDLDGSGDVPFT